MGNQSLASEKYRLGSAADALVAGIRERARNLYLTRQLLCTEAVMAALNKGLGGGLTDDQAVAVAAPFCAALGDSGCLCGALTGAVMAAGLFLGTEQAHRRRREMRQSANQLHDAFKAANGATCCRVLTARVKHDKKAHFDHCAELTAEAAAMAARLILEKRPDLAARADRQFLARRESKISGAALRVLRSL
jgi:C_GCAxxG_C_C family probable redox protein